MREVLAYLQDLGQDEYNMLPDYEWDALQDMQEVCQKIASRIAVLDDASFVAAAKVLPEEPSEMMQDDNKPGASMIALATVLQDA